MSDIKVSSAYPTNLPMDSTTPVTPHHQIRSTSIGVSTLSMSDRSHSDIKRKLEQRLADTKVKMYNIGRLGESLVQQEQELNDRIRELDTQSNDDEIKPELRSKLADLESGFKEVERESAKAFAKTIPFLGKENMGLPRTPGDSPTKSEFVGHGAVSPSKSSSRKARNATPRQHDIEFAADIGQGLLEEVRKLQALIAQRDQKLSEATASIARSDRQLELFDRKVKQMHEDQESLKEENWNMHLRGQEIQNQLNAAVADVSKYTIENTRLLAQTTTLTTAVESLKAKNVELSTNLAEAKTKHESEMSSLRRAQAGLQRDRSDLQRLVDELKIELTKRPEPRPDNLDEQLDDGELPERDGSITPAAQSPAISPQLSPIKNTPSRNAPLELETAKSSLHHAHRLVNNLRNTLHREKTEKVELRRLLAAAQDEVEQLRSKASSSKRAGKRPQSRRPIVDLLGTQRRTRHEITLQEDSESLDERSNEDGSSTSAAYVTAHEEIDSDSAFITATEHEMDETDTDAYRTGVESQSDSGDEGDLTETESSSSARRMPNLGYIREISPSIAFTSDEDDSPIRLPFGLRHRRSTVRAENGRRLGSSSFDPPPQPLFQELMEGAELSVVNSPTSIVDSPTSVGTAIPLFESRDVQTADIACQCDPIPEPEPIILQSPPVIVYKEHERASCVECGTQSDPIPEAEPEPPVIIYKERERPSCDECGTQSDPIPEPEPIIVEAPPLIVYKEHEKPECADMSTQSDPIPPPEPIIVQSDPIIVHAEPVTIIKYVEHERPISTDVSTQSDPIPSPEPIIIQSDPIVIHAEPVTIIEYVEPEKPISTNIGTQSDPIPLPEPIIIQSEPIIITPEPIIVTQYVEKEKPPTVETAVQSEPLLPPAEIIIYKEPEKPILIEIAVQSDPIPEPLPIVVPSEPIIIYRDRELPPSMDMGIQSEEMIIEKPAPVVVYVERERPAGNDMGTQFETIMPNVRDFGVQSNPETPSVFENTDKETQTLLSIPLLEPYRFNEQSLPSTTLRPRTPTSILPSPASPLSISTRQIATTSTRVSEEGTPRTVRTVSSPIEWETPPKSPLREINNSRRSQPGSPSRSSLRYADSPSTYSSRVGTSRRYGTILEHPTLHSSPRGSTVKARSHPMSPTKRQQTLSPAHSRMNMSLASRSTTAMSRRTSISSFESEVEDRFGLNREQPEGIGDGQYATSTDPRVIQSITQTMIGDYLYKYTRNQMQRSKISDKRHKRFFWIHPYTKTLYWSTDNPATSKDSKNNTRSAPIKRVAVVTDENPFPPGLFQKSILCFTQSRAIKFTALTKQSHETWLRALNHLLDRGPMLTESPEEEVGSPPPTAGTAEYSVDMREFGAIGTTRGSTHLASMSEMGTEDDTAMRHHGSFGRLSSIFRGDRDRGTMSTIKGKGPARSIYEASLVTDYSRQSHEHVHDIDEEGLENVRACCGGKHDVGTLSRKGKHTHK